MSEAAARAGQAMTSEIAEQPEVFAELVAHRAAVLEVARAVAERSPRFVLLAARGSSDLTETTRASPGPGGVAA